jgi:hypothetical protein
MESRLIELVEDLKVNYVQTKSVIEVTRLVNEARVKWAYADVRSLEVDEELFHKELDNLHDLENPKEVEIPDADVTEEE